MRVFLTILAATTALIAPPSLAQVTGAPGQSAQVFSLPPLEVLGLPLSRNTDDVAAPASVLAGPSLDRRRSATLGDTLKDVPGVSSSHFGPGAGRPIIRGFDGPRVRVMSDGIDTMDAASVSPDHAVTSDPFSARQIEILKGPSTLLYGGGAIGGVVNVIDRRIPTSKPAGGFEGETGVQYNTSANEKMGFLGFSVGYGNVVMRLEGSARSAEDYYTARSFGDPPSRRVPNSFNEGTNFSFGTSYVADWGYVGASYGEFRTAYGIPAEEDVFIRMLSRRLDVRAEVRDPVDFIEKVRFRFGHVWYRHQEVEGGEVATTFNNRALDTRVEVIHRPFEALRGVFGVQAHSRDFTAVGDEAFLPPTLTRGFGVFLVERFSFSEFHIEAGLRYDWQRITAEGGLPTTRHGAFSASIAGTWDFAPGFSTTLSFSRSQRAPTAEELYANGPHIATGQFEIGDTNLRTETSYNLELGVRKKTGKLQFGASIYRNVVKDFIFQADTGVLTPEDLRIINFRQADAELYGLEVEAKYAVTDNIDVTVFGDYVRARLINSDNIPRIPPGRIGTRIDGRLDGWSAYLQYYHVFGQGHVAPFETGTPSYNMVDAGIAYGGSFAPGTSYELYLRANNLLNQHAVMHTSFIKESVPLPGLNVTFGGRLKF